MTQVLIEHVRSDFNWIQRHQYRLGFGVVREMEVGELLPHRLTCTNGF